MSLSFVGCIDRESGPFREFSKSEEDRMTKVAEEAIAKSGPLKQLYDECRDIPYFDRVEPLSKYLGRNKDFISLHYSIEGLSFETLSKSGREHLLRKGWSFVREETGFWETQIEFSKENLWIQISKGNFGKANYALNCKDSSILNNR